VLRRSNSNNSIFSTSSFSRWTGQSAVPGIYTKLLDADKVDLIIGAYGTNMLAPAMPVAMQRRKVLIGLFGIAVNSAFNYPNYFSMIPTGPRLEELRAAEREAGSPRQRWRLH
jgi:hypothetical protein